MYRYKCGQPGNKEELELHMPLLQHCWNNRYSGRAHVWWEQCDSRIQAPREDREGRRERLERALYRKEQLVMDGSLIKSAGQDRKRSGYE